MADATYDGDRFVESTRYVRSYPTELPILGDLPRSGPRWWGGGYATAGDGTAS